jgi:hypothetical protein
MKTKLTLVLAGCILNLATSYAQRNTSSWLLKGNSGTDSSKHFIGTSDAQPLVFRVNNQKAGYLDYDSLKGNTSFGYKSLGKMPPGTGRFNTTVGYQTLATSRGGTANTALGYQSLFNNGFGDLNTATGFQALYDNWRGYENTAYGAFALFSNGNGRFNTACGFQALFTSYGSRYNTATGYQALYSNYGHMNTASGWQALSGNTTGNLNTALGTWSLRGNSTGNRNTALGFRADVMGSDLKYATAIGAFAIVDTSVMLIIN